MVNIGDFEDVKECDYKGEHYSVRDNGAVCRYSRPNTRRRKMDNAWSFGIEGNHGYLYLCSIPVHRIVATAFIGSAPTPQHIVDHIDTNRQNNRPENLRWVTKEENILNNPATVKKIELITGHPISDIIENFSLLHNIERKTNVSKMRPVTKEDGIENKNRIQKWANYATFDPNFMPDDQPYFKPSLTEHACQVVEWKTDGYFPCVERCSKYSLEEYLSVLKPNDLIYQARDIESYRFQFKKGEISADGQFLYLICEQPEGVKQNAFMIIKREGSSFVHSCKRFFDEKGPEHELCKAMNREWTGGDYIDLYMQ